MVPFVIDYGQIVAVMFCVAFFAEGARMDQRSPLLWGGLSFGLRLVGSQLVVGGLTGGLLSQVLLFAGLIAWESVRERRAARARASDR